MDFFSQTYVAIRGPTGATPDAHRHHCSGRLSDRLSPATLLADRRAVILALKSLSRDCKQEVLGESTHRLTGRSTRLYNDAEVDADIGKAILETLDILCNIEDAAVRSQELYSKHTDVIVSSDKTTHTLLVFVLLADNSFYTCCNSSPHFFIIDDKPYKVTFWLHLLGPGV